MPRTPHPAHLRLVDAGAAAQPASSPEPRWRDDECASPSSSHAPRLASLPDAQLVALGVHGDRAALEALYRRHCAFAIQLATRIEGSSRDVEDVAHDAFLKAFTRLAELHDRAAFRSWLGSIVVHAVRSRMRRARLMNMLGLGKAGEPVDLDAVTSSEASPATRAQIAQIYALLGTMPTDERIAWTLRCVEGHDLESVARMTRCSLATVKRRISRVQRFLEEHFIDPSAPAADDEGENASRARASRAAQPAPVATSRRAVHDSGRKSVAGAREPESAEDTANTESLS